MHSNSELWQKVDETIKHRGWQLIYVYGDDHSLPFTYSVGAALPSRPPLPEVIISNINPEDSATLINDFLDYLSTGAEISETIAYTEIANLPMYIRKLTPKQVEHHMTMTKAIHEDLSNIPLYQMVYPDPQGIFPWEAGYNFPEQELLYLRT